MSGLEYGFFTEEDAEYLLSVLNSGFSETEVLEVSKIEIPVITVEELDLEALSGALHGLTDPIGQLKDWFYDRLNEIASWFADVVDGIVRSIWDTIIKPVIDTIYDVVSSIWEYIQQVPGTVSDLITWLGDQITSAWDTVYNTVIEPIMNFFEDLTGKISEAINTVSDFLMNIASTISDVLEDVKDTAWQFIQNYIIKPLQDAFNTLSSYVNNIVSSVVDFFTKTLPEKISGFIDFINQLFNQVKDFVNTYIIKPLSDIGKQALDLISQGISGIVDFFTKTIPEYINKAIDTLTEWVSQAWDMIQQYVIDPLTNVINSFIDTVSKGVSGIVDFFTKTLPDMINGVVKTIGEIAGKAWNFIQENIIKPMEDSLRSFINTITEWVESAIDNVIKSVSGALESVVDTIVSLPQKVWESLVVAGQTIWDYITGLAGYIQDGFKKVSEVLEGAMKALQTVGQYFTGFINAIMMLPEKLYGVFKTVLDTVSGGIKTIADFFEGVKSALEKPWEWVQENIIKPIVSGVQTIANMIMEGLHWVWDRLVDVGKWLWGAITSVANAVFEAVKGGVEAVIRAVQGAVDWLYKTFILPGMNAVLGAVRKTVQNVLLEALKSGGEKGEFWVFLAIPAQLLPYLFGFMSTNYIIEEGSEIIEEVDAELDAAPLSVGVKARIKAALGKAIKWLGKMGTDVSKAILQGFMIGIGLTALDPFKYVTRPIAKNFFSPVFEEALGIDMFFELPGREDVLKFMRLALPQKILSKLGVGAKEGVEFKPYMKWEDAKEYASAVLKVYGLPDKFTELYKLEDTDFYLKFVDRFGKSRMIPLSPVYELMTHSELLRMTQKDIFPSPRVAMGVASLRGWAPDLTVMSYLLTFKYPSFEKLWKFYMRSTAGMLWFSPPDAIKNMFINEASQIGAGAPIAPLDIQRAIKTPDALQGIEIAINTYFKWLEYSNFSWFTPGTVVNGVPVGKEIYNKLGGWTADSWIMADVAADIPGKIDLRWMSRYGIFMWLSDMLEKQGVTFESYTPLVDVIPYLLKDTADSKIEVRLEWFSKLLQATGLHPAWIPLVTVAENIMVISDEMTLIRTGWINLFKEGMLDIGTVDKALDGILKVSYRVGYWNPKTKAWTKGYITLPVRWLPHERRLLELRALMDRVLDLYREFEKYVGSGVRSLSITASEGLDLLSEAIDILNEHYSKVSEAITGQKLSISFDKEYESLRLALLEKAQIIEVRERLRYWWFRVSGWLLYRVASGYVKEEDIDKLFESVKQTIPLFDTEIEGYKVIAKAMLGVAVKENIPTPSTLATLNEIIEIPEKLIDKVFEARNIPQEFRSIWKEYIIKKPLKDDFSRLLTDYYRAKRYGVTIPEDVDKRIRDMFNYFKVTKTEQEIRELEVYLENLVEESKVYIPTPSMLASLNEYIAVPIDLIKQVLEKRHIPSEWRDIWFKYIMVKPLKSDYKSLISVGRRAYVMGVITEKEWKSILEEASKYGFREEEIRIYTRIADLYWLIEYSKEYIPTPSMLASMAEYIEIPTEYIQYVFEKRNVPKEWRRLWYKYIMVKPLSDEIRRLLSAYFDVKYSGVVLPSDVDKEIKKILSEYGVSKKELRIRELTELLESLKESVPSLGTLASMAEYIEVPIDYIQKVLKIRNVDKTFAELWVRYVQVRNISSEVNAVVSVYKRIYEYFFVPPEVEKQIKQVMMRGGWTKNELEILKLELDLRKDYRIMSYLIPTIRGFVTDARYLPEWETLFDDLLKARGIDTTKYQKQIEYYKKLIRNRMVWRQISWYRNRVVYAYATGVIDKETAKKKLESLKKYGLSDAEVELILDGMELYKASKQAEGY